MKEAVAQGRKVYGISRWPYRWIKSNVLSGYLLDLAPSEKLLDDETFYIENDDEFLHEFKTTWAKKYVRHLNKNKNTVIELLKRLDSENSVLCCFEKDCYTCHRGLLSHFVSQHNLGIEINEI